MNNERAINIIGSITQEDTKEDVVTKVFACEDIIEQDVNEWTEIPLPIHLSQFVDHCNAVATKFINSRCEIFGYDDGVKIEMHNLRDKTESVMISMIKYAACYGAIKKESESES